MERPISDMTEGEKDEVITLSALESTKIIEIHKEGISEPYYISHEPKVTLWLIEKGFKII